MKLTAAVFAIAAAAIGCSGAGGGSGTPGTGGSGGGGTSGGAGGGSGVGGTNSSFSPVPPCAAEASYTTGSLVQFGLNGAHTYEPACLKVTAGATVTFSGDFVTHPLTPSAARGMLTGNPITATGTGTTASFTFPSAGLWAYTCLVHGSDADGRGMDGVIWVE